MQLSWLEISASKVVIPRGNEYFDKGSGSLPSMQPDALWVDILLYKVPHAALLGVC